MESNDQTGLTGNKGRLGEAAVGGRVYNERGVIAESYHDLQGLGLLAKARSTYPLPKASGPSTLRAVFQAAEIALLNLADLLERAAVDIDGGALGHAAVKLSWSHGFHRLLMRLSLVPQQLALSDGGEAAPGVLRIDDSPALAAFAAALDRFDRAMLHRIDSGDVPLDTALSDWSLDSPVFNLIHLARVSNHESTIWEQNLSAVRVFAPVPSYAEFVVSEGMREAVFERVLSGDTYLTQFRGLHQVPETLGEEMNDRVEQAILEMRAHRLQRAAEHLACVNVLADAVLAAMPPIAECLATADYHQIRENLGLTSGSHSVGLRYHLFTHLYEQLWEELEALLSRLGVSQNGTGDIEAALREVAHQRFEDGDAWLLHLLAGQCLQFRAFILNWRDQHLHLPRNNLGSDLTKSLTGSPDAIRAVRQMKDTAIAKDPMRALARSRDLDDTFSGAPGGRLAAYLTSTSSLDYRILSVTGSVTQRRFQNVQERLGYFANRSAFAPPPRRRA